MNSRPRPKPAQEVDDFPLNALRLAAWGAAANGMMLGVTAGLTWTFLQALFRRSNHSFRPIKLITRPLTLGTAFGAFSYITAFTNNSPLTLFVKRRAEQEQKRMQEQHHEHEHDSKISRVNSHN